MMMIDNPLILSLATWAWDSDPSPLVTPTACLDSLPLLATPCLTRLIAKGIGIGILVLSCVNKAPVIGNIIKSGSVAGLSVAASYGEVIMYANSAFYNLLRGNPFTAYGETFSIMLQTMIVVTLIWLYDPKNGRGTVAKALAVFSVYLFVVFQVLTEKTQFILMVYNPMVLCSTRGAQIWENYSNKQTGAQSIVTTGMNLAGSAVRIATTIKEVGWDFHILRAYGTSVFFNVILFSQILMYKSNTEKFLKRLAEKKD